MKNPNWLLMDHSLRLKVLILIAVSQWRVRHVKPHSSRSWANNFCTSQKEKNCMSHCLHMHPISSHGPYIGRRRLVLELACLLILIDQHLPKWANIGTVRRHKHWEALHFKHFWDQHIPLVQHGEQSRISDECWDHGDARAS